MSLRLGLPSAWSAQNFGIRCLVRILILLLIIALYACDVRETETEVRGIWWSSELAKLMETKPEMKTVLESLSEYNPVFDEVKNTISITEVTAGDGVVCSKWQHDITIYGDNNGRVSRTAKSMVGICL